MGLQVGFTQKFIQLQGENLKIRFSELIQIWTKAVPCNCPQRTSSLIGYYINWMKVYHEVVIFQLLRAQILGSSLMTFFSHTLYSLPQGIILYLQNISWTWPFPPPSHVVFQAPVTSHLSYWDSLLTDLSVSTPSLYFLFFTQYPTDLFESRVLLSSKPLTCHVAQHISQNPDNGLYSLTWSLPSLPLLFSLISNYFPLWSLCSRHTGILVILKMGTILPL